jgi:hypothetical protein
MSSSLKILYDNAADRCTLTAGSEATPKSNLLTDSKSDVWRTAAGTVSTTLTATWASPEAVSCVALPFCNLSQTATMRVRLYSDAAGTALVLDTGTKLCAQGLPMSLYGMSAAQAASAYSYGGGTVARCFFTAVSVRKVVIDIVDGANLQGYLEAARLVIGDCFSTKYNVSYGLETTWEDSTENKRTDAGNLVSDLGYKYKAVKADLEVMSPSERAAWWKLTGFCGTGVPVFFSVETDNVDKQAELDYSVYGKFSKVSTVAAKSYLIYSSPLEIEGI